MRRIGMLSAALAAALALAACAVTPGPHGGAVVVAPALPTVVVLEDEPYYHYHGYHYHYTNNVWYYSESRSGPWKDLPKDRYPKEVRHKGKHKGWEKEEGEKKGHGKHD